MLLLALIYELIDQPQQAGGQAVARRVSAGQGRRQ
jgi:hypothetical protein